ncbi:MAG: hypothetical protein H6679_01730 [Epsilonproteobacteria bacterium]|nr:hypothetical protein [Campylobacterota bacterium]
MVINHCKKALFFALMCLAQAQDVWCLSTNIDSLDVSVGKDGLEVVQKAAVQEEQQAAQAVQASSKKKSQGFLSDIAQALFSSNQDSNGRPAKLLNEAQSVTRQIERKVERQTQELRQEAARQARLLEAQAKKQAQEMFEDVSEQINKLHEKVNEEAMLLKNEAVKEVLELVKEAEQEAIEQRAKRREQELEDYLKASLEQGAQVQLKPEFELTTKPEQKKKEITVKHDLKPWKEKMLAQYRDNVDLIKKIIVAGEAEQDAREFLSFFGKDKAQFESTMGQVKDVDGPEYKKAQHQAAKLDRLAQAQKEADAFIVSLAKDIDMPIEKARKLRVASLYELAGLMHEYEQNAEGHAFAFEVSDDKVRSIVKKLAFDITQGQVTELPKPADIVEKPFPLLASVEKVQSDLTKAREELASVRADNQQLEQQLKVMAKEKDGESLEFEYLYQQALRSQVGKDKKLMVMKKLVASEQQAKNELQRQFDKISVEAASFKRELDLAREFTHLSKQSMELALNQKMSEIIKPILIDSEKRDLDMQLELQALKRRADSLSKISDREAQGRRQAEADLAQVKQEREEIAQIQQNGEKIIAEQRQMFDKQTKAQVLRVGKEKRQAARAQRHYELTQELAEQFTQEYGRRARRSIESDSPLIGLTV